MTVKTSSAMFCSPWKILIMSFALSNTACTSLQSTATVKVDKSPDYEDSIIITIPRGSAHRVTCANHTGNSSSGSKNSTKTVSMVNETVQILEASYVETPGSASTPATFTVPACKDHAELRKSFRSSCNIDTATSCMFEAKNSLDRAECRWQYLAITYQCAVPPWSEISEITTMVGQDIILD